MQGLMDINRNFKARRFMWQIALLFFVILFSGCATVSHSPVPDTKTPKVAWETYQRNLHNIDHWQATGVIGIIIDGKGHSANYIWKQGGLNDYFLNVYGPLGIGSTTFEGSASKVTMTTSKGDKITATTAESLMRQQLGWAIPIKGMYYWARGLYVPKVPHKYTLNNSGLIKTLSQSHWKIDYQNYALFMSTYPLPQKIIFTRNDIKVTLIISSWTIK